MDDLRTFTREPMENMARDLDTRLDWVAVDAKPRKIPPT